MSHAAPAEGDATARRGWILLACLIATFASAIEATIVATALPSIVAQLGDFTLLAWVFSIYMLGQAVSIPLFGRLADIHGRKRAFHIGAGLFLAGSALCGLAGSMQQLVLFRALQGIGAGGVQPIANTIVGDIYTREERARMQGLLSAVYGISAVVGPSLGSFLVQHESWPAVFWINLPIGITAVALIARLLPETAPRERHAVDYLGSVLLMLGIGAGMYAIRALILDLLHGHGFGNGVALCFAAISALALAALARHERRTADPILPLELWRDRIIAVGCLAGGVAGALMMGVAAFLPAYVQGVLGGSAALAGFVLALMSVLWTLASIAAGPVLRRTSYRRAAVIGALLLLAGMAVLTAMTPAYGVGMAAMGSAFVGLGMGFWTTTCIVSIQSAVPRQKRGAATSSVMFLRCLGQAVGVATCGAVVNLSIALLDPAAEPALHQLLHARIRGTLPAAELTQLTQVLAQSLHNAFLVAGALAVATLVLALRLPLHLSPVNQPSTE